MFDDINFLVQETLDDAEKGSRGKKLFDHFFNKKIDVPKETPGVLYRVQKSASTFVIRSQPSLDLRQDYEGVLKHSDLYPSLRFTSEDSIEEELRFFACDSVEVAKCIRLKFGNKRFPIFEENVFNISDPGDCWWLKSSGDKITIFFKLSHTQDMSELVKLGPLGDPKDSMETFSSLAGYFQMLFPVADYSSGFGQFSISTSEEGNLRFKQFLDLLKTGETEYEFWEYLRLLESNKINESYIDDLRSANHFIMELSQLRTFWTGVQLELAQ